MKIKINSQFDIKGCYLKNLKKLFRDYFHFSTKV